MHPWCDRTNDRLLSPRFDYTNIIRLTDTEGAGNGNSASTFAISSIDHQFGDMADIIPTYVRSNLLLASDMLRIAKKHELPCRFWISVMCLSRNVLRRWSLEASLEECTAARKGRRLPKSYRMPTTKFQTQVVAS